MEGFFYILEIDGVSADEADLIAELAFEFGASGTEEKIPFKQDGRHYEPTQLSSDSTALKIYFEKNMPPKELLEKLETDFPEIIMRSYQEKNKDWMEEWKKGFEPFELCKNIWVVPSWREIPAEAKMHIRMDPGMAFGTGTHETTRLAAGFLEFYFSKIKNADKSLFDVGTGTGILAFLAELIGFGYISANDIDPIATRVARENADLNKFNKTIFIDDTMASTKRKYDCVVANIIDGVLCDMQKELREHVNAKGYLLLTGILQEREANFLKEFSFDGFQIIERRQLGEWVGLLLNKID